MALSPNYGTTRKTMDEQICRTKLTHVEHFAGYGAIDDTGPVSKYLKRRDGSQAFYVPEYTVIACQMNAVIGNVTTAYDTSYCEHITSTFLVYRDGGGNVTIVIDPATPQTEVLGTITPTANTTVQGFELVISQAASVAAQTVFTSVSLTMNIANEDSYKNSMSAFGTAALSTAE